MAKIIKIREDNTGKPATCKFFYAENQFIEPGETIEVDDATAKASLATKLVELVGKGE